MTGWGVVLVVVVAAVVGVGAWLLSGHDEKAARAVPVGPRPGEPGYVDDCVVNASCEDGDHTYSWPCVWAAGTGWRWVEESDPRPPSPALRHARTVVMPDRSGWDKS